MKYLFIVVMTITILFANSSILQAQRPNKGEKVQGFVINNKQDTIHGIIEIEDYELAEIRVKFSERRGKDLLKEKTYKPKSLIGYSLKIPINNNSSQIQETWIYYERKEALDPPRPFASTAVFMEKRETGRLNLYSYYIRSNSAADLLQYFILEHSNSEKLVKVTEDNFDEIAQKYLKGCSILKNRFGRADFSYLNLVRIIHIYNRCNMEAIPDNG